MKTPSIVQFLVDMFPDTLVARPVASRDGRGKVTAYSGAAQNIPCRITGDDQKKTYKKDGKVFAASTVARCAGVFGLTTDFEYTLPVGYKPQNPECVHVSSSPDENGAHHQTVYFL